MNVQTAGHELIQNPDSCSLLASVTVYTILELQYNALYVLVSNYRKIAVTHVLHHFASKIIKLFQDLGSLTAIKLLTAKKCLIESKNTFGKSCWRQQHHKNAIKSSLNFFLKVEIEKCLAYPIFLTDLFPDFKSVGGGGDVRISYIYGYIFQYFCSVFPTLL